MKLIAELIGYAATATVITFVIGLGYLWGSRRLDDEKMFRMVALLHDVDIDRIASETEADASEVPSEEPSPADIEWQRQVLARNYEVKMEALKRGKLNFDASFQGLITAKNQFNEMAVKFEREIVEKGELSNRQNLLNVVQNLELMKADQAKEELLNILKDDDSIEGDKGIEDAIKIMNAMQPAKLKKILQKFQTKEELDDLHMIYEVMLNGGTEQAAFNETMEKLNRFKSK